MSFSGESGLRKAGLCGIHPLTQRYATGGKYLWSNFLHPFSRSFF
nr:DUF3265 domain-containing protein [Vibrio vulnificus]